MHRAAASFVGALTWAALLVLISLVGVGMAAFLQTPLRKLPADAVLRTSPPDWALPPGRVVLLVPEGSAVPAEWPYARPIPDWKLRAVGFVVVHTTAELERAVQDGAVVIWLQREAVHRVDPGWLRDRHRDGHPVGVIDGTMDELWDWFGIGQRNGSWLRAGGVLPTFVLVDGRRCRVGPSGPTIEPPDPSRWLGGGTSEHFSLGWVLSLSHQAATFCT
jgi:hypothetical protein